jgi:hypothetical protein
VGFVVKKVALGQVFLRIVWINAVSVIPLWLSMLVYYVGDEQLVAAVQRHRLTSIDMNNTDKVNE